MFEKQLSICPSILAADFSMMSYELSEIADAGCDHVHLDVMDGHFVPSITFGDKFVRDLRGKSDLIFDTHLMVEKPENYISQFLDAGSDIITIHQEATNHLDRCLRLIKDGGKSAGVAINPGTSISTLYSVLDLVDYILVMTVNPGWGGQKFIPSSLKKIHELNAIRDKEGYIYQIEVDGGINRATLKACYNEGATLMVMGTSFFHESDKATFVTELMESVV